MPIEERDYEADRAWRNRPLKRTLDDSEKRKFLRLAEQHEKTAQALRDFVEGKPIQIVHDHEAHDFDPFEKADRYNLLDKVYCKFQPKPVK